jgi:hypothetical protein
MTSSSSSSSSTPPPPPPPQRQQSKVPPTTTAAVAPTRPDVRVRNAVTVSILLVLTYLIYWRSISAISQNDFGKYDKFGNAPADADDEK